jgi:CO/xanthine dehydrogenase FAD-binding subunit
MPLLNQFRYECPSSLEELGILLADQAGAIPRYLAGGTDLMVAMRAGKVSPELVVDLKGLPGLAGIDVREGKLLIGSLTTIHSLEISEVIRSRAAALFEAARNLGSWQVRNRGTVGGNLANGSPTADTAAPLLALDAEIVAWSPGGNRKIPAASFWLGAGKTVLETGEMITGVEIPLKQGTSSAYTKLGPRGAMDIAIAGAAVVLQLDRGLIREARIAMGGAGPTPIRALSAENHLTGKPASIENIRRAGKMAADDSNPRTSSRASREYRLAVIPVLVERTIKAALERQQDGPAAGRTDEGQGGESR